MAVVSALLVVAIVAALTSGLFLRQTSAIRQIENEQARIQARWLLLGGVDWSRLILHDNAREGPTVRRDQLWATPVQDTRVEADHSTEDAVFSGHIEDEQGKYNLYNVSRDGVVDPGQAEILARLFNLLALPDSLSTRIATQVALSQPREAVKEQTQPDHIEAGDAALAPMPRGIDDIAALLGVERDVRQRMRRTLTLLPEATQVNVNTAEPEVIAALVAGLTLSQARSLIGERDRGLWFNDSADFSNRLSSYGDGLAVPPVVTGSDWFMAHGTVAYMRSRVSMQALLNRVPNGSPRTVWIRETP